MRAFLVAAIAVANLVALGACSQGPGANVDAGVAATLPPGMKQIERMQYNDVTDVWRVFLVGRPDKNEPERVPYLRLAHLPDADVKAGKKPYLQVDAGGPVAYLGSGFRIGLLHGFVEERPDPATGNNVHVVTRTEKKWWEPFGGKLLVTGADPYADPAFYYPPPLHDGPLTGVGGKGATKDAAADNYRAQNGALPQAVRLKTDGFREQLVDTGAGAAPKLVDPATSLDNRIVGALPGSPADRAQRAKKAGGAGAGAKNAKKKNHR